MNKEVKITPKVRGNDRVTDGYGGLIGKFRSRLLRFTTWIVCLLCVITVLSSVYKGKKKNDEMKKKKRKAAALRGLYSSRDNRNETASRQCAQGSSRAGDRAPGTHLWGCRACGLGGPSP